MKKELLSRITLFAFLLAPTSAWAHGGIMAGMAFIFLYIYAFFIVPVTVFLIFVILTGLPCLFLYKRVFPEIAQNYKRSIFTLLFLQTVLLICYFFLPFFRLTKPELLNKIIQLIGHSDFLAIKLFGLIVQQDIILLYIVSFAQLFWILILVNIFFASITNFNKKIVSTGRRLGFILCHGFSPVILVFLLLIAYTLIPRIQPLAQIAFLPDSRPANFFEMTHNNRQERLDKMLIFASQTSIKEILTLLLKNGASPNSLDKHKNPALLVASNGTNSSGNRDATFKLLVEAGADINARDKKGFPILIGIMESSLSMETKEYFLELNPDLNAGDKHGMVPVMHYYSRENREMVWKMIEQGADINVIAPGGQTLLGMALERKDREFADELIDMGAEINKTREIGHSGGYGKVATSAAAQTFMSAVKTGDLETIRYMVDNGFDINTKDRSKRTGIYYAFENYNKDAILFLLKNGADTSGVDALKTAVRKSDVETTKLLLENGAQITTEFSIAISINNEEMVKLFLDHATDFVKKTFPFVSALENAAQKGNTNTISLLMDYQVPPGRSLQYAVRRGDIETVKVLLEKGADINAKNAAKHWATPLAIAAGRADISMVQFLLNQGADPNILGYSKALEKASQSKNKEIVKLLLKHGVDPNVVNNYEQRPISLASIEYDPEIVELLLKNGFDLHHQDSSGGTVLIQAVNRASKDSVQFLLDLGADPNQAGKYGATPLKSAISDGKTKIVRLLIQHGADPNISDKKGRTALWWSVYYSDAQMVKLLLENGAKLNVVNNQGQTVLQALLGREIKHRVTQKTVRQMVAGYAGKGKSASPTIGEIFDFSVKKDLATARVLLDHGLDPLIKDHSGQSAYSIALDERNEKLAHLFEEYMK